MDTNSKFWYFENFNLLEALSEDEKMKLSERSNHYEAPRKEVLYFPEDPTNRIYFLKRGKVKISTYSDDGREMILSILGPGEIFGEMGLTGDSKREHFAEATEDVSYCTTSLEDFQDLVEKNPKFNLQITKMIGFRFKKIQSRLESLCFKPAPDRIKQFIVDMVDEHGRDVGYEKEVKLNLTHQNIADLTATSRQTVTSVLNDLEKKDLILYDRKRILVRDVEALKP